MLPLMYAADKPKSQGVLENAVCVARVCCECVLRVGVASMCCECGASV